MKIRSTYVWLRNFTSLLLLFGYFLNVISFESFHQAVHNHDHAELHTQEAEADACHRAIYHGGVSHECEHRSHIIETESDCQLCDVVVSRTHVFSAYICLTSTENQLSEYFLTQPENASIEFYDDNSPRGPPTVS